MNPMTPEEIDRAVLRASGLVPGIQVRPKSESWLMLLIGWVIWPFNPTFMSYFTTTIGSTIYTPTSSPLYPSVFWHEVVHIWDSRQNRVSYELSYLMPQILVGVPLAVYILGAGWGSWTLAIPLVGYIHGLALGIPTGNRGLFFVAFGLSVLAFVGFAVWLTGWWSLSLIGVALCLVPWPSPWRVHWESRGYAMSVAYLYWTLGSAPNWRNYASFFYGPNYYWMAWSRSPGKWVRRWEEVASGVIQDQEPYAYIHRVLSE